MADKTLQADSAPVTDIPSRIEHHADAILRASGSGLRNYTMPGTRRAILAAVLDLYEEAMRRGADMAVDAMRDARSKTDAV